MSHLVNQMRGLCCQRHQRNKREMENLVPERAAIGIIIYRIGIRCEIHLEKKHIYIESLLELRQRKATQDEKCYLMIHKGKYQ